MNNEIKSKLLQFICDSFMVEEDEIDHDKSLIDEGIIDSFGLIEIASFMEKQYAITVGEDQMIRDNFGSLNKMVTFIEREAGPSDSN